MALSVAICTHDRAPLLQRALASVAAQRAHVHEVIVVDNAPSDDATRAMVRAQFPTVHYTCEPVQGLDFARNRALGVATGDVVLFLDDDAVADAGWAEAIAAVMRDPRVGVCTGRVEAMPVETEAQRMFEANGGFSRGMVRRRLPPPPNRVRLPLIVWAFDVGAGCSMAVRRGTALELGGFDEALDLGAALPGGGDHDMLWRMLQAGYDVVYEPAALARHEHRREMEAAAAQIVGQQRAMVALLTKCLTTARGARRASVAAYLVWRLAKPGVRLVRRAVGRDPLPAAVLARMWYACWRGVTAYGAARRLAMQRKEDACAPTHSR